MHKVLLLLVLRYGGCCSRISQRVLEPANDFVCTGLQVVAEALLHKAKNGHADVAATREAAQASS